MNGNDAICMGVGDGVGDDDDVVNCMGDCVACVYIFVDIDDSVCGVCGVAFDCVGQVDV